MQTSDSPQRHKQRSERMLIQHFDQFNQAEQLLHHKSFLQTGCSTPSKSEYAENAKHPSNCSELDLCTSSRQAATRLPPRRSLVGQHGGDTSSAHGFALRESHEVGAPPPREPIQLYITRAFEKWPPSRCASSAWWAATASRPTGFQKRRYVKLFGQWGSRLASAGLRSLARPPRPALASLALGSPALSSQRLRRVSACGLRPFIGVCPPPAPVAGPRPAGAAFGRALGPVRPPKGGSLPSAPVVFLRQRPGTPPPAGGALRAPPAPSRFRIIYGSFTDHCGSLRIIFG